jgi:hypothetical protein
MARAMRPQPIWATWTRFDGADLPRTCAGTIENRPRAARRVGRMFAADMALTDSVYQGIAVFELVQGGHEARLRAGID